MSIHYNDGVREGYRGYTTHTDTKNKTLKYIQDKDGIHTANSDGDGYFEDHRCVR